MVRRTVLFKGQLAFACAALAALVSALPASATPGPAVTYNVSASLSCVLAPGVLNVPGAVPVQIAATGPAYVESGDSFSLTNAQSTLSTPASWSGSFLALGATYVGGVISSFPLDVTNGTPASVNAALAAPYDALNVEEIGPGLPFGTDVIPGTTAAPGPLQLTIPVTTTPAVDTTQVPSVPYDRVTGTPTGFNVGPFAVTGAAGASSVLSIDTAPAFTKTGTKYTVNPNQGIVSQAEGYPDSSGDLNDPTNDPDGEVVAGPLGVYCNAPAYSLGSVPIVAPAAVTMNPMDVTASSLGATVTFTAAASGTPAPNVQWLVATAAAPTVFTPDTTDSGYTSDTLSVVASAANVGDHYRAEYTNSVSNPAATPSGPYTISTVESSSATLNGPVLVPCSSPPVITTHPSSVTLTAPAAGMLVSVGSTPTGCLPPSVQWLSEAPGATSFTPISGATSPTLPIPPTTVAESGTEYEVTYTNAAGSTTSTQVTLTVNPPGCSTPPAITTQPASATVTAPATATFTAAAATPAACVETLAWSSEAPGATSFTPITGATSGSYTTPATTLAESGTKYEATFTNAFGSTTSSAATLTVNAVASNAAVVTRVSPNSGGPYSLVFITGSNFNGARAVDFGTKPALFLALSPSLIIALVPSGNSGTVDVTVHSRNGTSALSSVDKFAYR